MPLTIPRNEELAQKAQALYIPGVFGYKRVARQLGLNHSTTVRYCNPASTESSRQSSRAAKLRRKGTCIDCGATTTYNGRTNNGPSVRCLACAAHEVGKEREGTGPVQQQLLAALEKNGEMTFTAIYRELGITKNHASPLLDRARKLGLVERPRRGVYALPVKKDGE